MIFPQVSDISKNKQKKKIKSYLPIFDLIRKVTRESSTKSEML